MYYIKLDNKLDRTIEKEMSEAPFDKVNFFLFKNNINQSNNIEIAIYKSGWDSLIYAEHIIKCRFELGEQAIAKNVYTSFLYAKDVIKGRFYIGEPLIKNSICKEIYKEIYENHFGIKL